jgi:hypothetical protein
MFKKRKLRKLKKYYENIMHPKSPFPAGYIESKTSEIQTLEWLISYYEGRTASTPKKLLESYITMTGYYTNNPSLESMKETLKSIAMLYDWVYNNRITGF